MRYGRTLADLGVYNVIHIAPFSCIYNPRKESSIKCAMDTALRLVICTTRQAIMLLSIPPLSTSSANTCNVLLMTSFKLACALQALVADIMTFGAAAAVVWFYSMVSSNHYSTTNSVGESCNDTTGVGVCAMPQRHTYFDAYWASLRSILQRAAMHV